MRTSDTHLLGVPEKLILEKIILKLFKTHVKVLLLRSG